MTARVAIRTVRFKAGGEVRVLHPVVDQVRGTVERSIRDVLDEQGAIAGFALVTWDNEGGSACAHWHVPGSAVPTVMIPDFVRNRLLLGIAVSWTLEDVNKALGFTPDGAA